MCTKRPGFESIKHAEDAKVAIPARLPSRQCKNSEELLSLFHTIAGVTLIEEVLSSLFLLEHRTRVASVSTLVTSLSKVIEPLGTARRITFGWVKRHLVQDQAPTGARLPL